MFERKTLLRANITCQILSIFQFLKLVAKNFHNCTINTSVFCSLLFFVRVPQKLPGSGCKSKENCRQNYRLSICSYFGWLWQVQDVRCLGLSRQVQIMIQLLGRHNCVCSQNTKVGRKLEPPSMKHAISLCVLKTIQRDTLCPTCLFVDISGEQMFINIYFSFQE